MSNIENEQREFDIAKIIDTDKDDKIEKEELEKLGFKVNYKQLEQEIINSNWKNFVPAKYQPEIENKNAEEKKAYVFLFQIWKKILWPKQFEILTSSLPLNEIAPFLYELALIEKEKDLLKTATIILTQDEIKELKEILASGATKSNLKKLKEFIEQQLNENITSAELIKWTKLAKAFENQGKNPYEIANNIDEVWYKTLSKYLPNISKDTLRNMATGFSIALIKIYNKSNGKLNIGEFLTPEWLKKLFSKKTKESIGFLWRFQKLIDAIKSFKTNKKFEWENNEYLMNPEKFSQLVYNVLTKWLDKKEILKTLKEWEQNQEVQLNKDQLHQQLQNLYDKAGELIKPEQIKSLWILSEIGGALKWIKKNIEAIRNHYKQVALNYSDDIIQFKETLESMWMWKFFKKLFNIILKLLGFKNWWGDFEKEAEKKFHYVTDWFKTTLTIENLFKENNKNLVFTKYFKKHKVQQIKASGKLSYETLKFLAYPNPENKQQINQKLQEIFNYKNLEANLKKAWIKPEDFYKKAFKVEEQTSKKDKIKIKVGVVDFDYIDEVLKTIYKDEIQQVVETPKKQEINNYQQAKVSYESLKKPTIKQTIQEIASKTNVPEEIIYAIWVNESSLASLGSNPTRFEEHIYNRYVKQWISPEKAKLLATSYGPFQIMWFNYKACGYNSVEEFVQAMKTPQWQLNAIINFINNNPELKEAMQEKDFHKIAKIYNWPAYQKNQYAEKLAFYTQKYNEQIA